MLAAVQAAAKAKIVVWVVDSSNRLKQLIKDGNGGSSRSGEDDDDNNHDLCRKIGAHMNSQLMTVAF